MRQDRHVSKSVKHCCKLCHCGRNRACTAVNKAFADAITVKVGAEGVYSAAFHDAQLGLMLKARDGSKRGLRSH